MKLKDSLTIGEVAASFGWSTRFVEALVRSEKIPGLEIDGKYYFRRTDILDWLDQKIQTIDADRLRELEKKIEADLDQPNPIAQRLSFRAHLDPSSVELDMILSSKRTVIETLVDLATNSGQVLDRSHLLAAVIERESLLSTALPGGIAICHPRRPVPSAINDTVLAFLRTKSPIHFGAEDGPTQLFFLLAATDEKSHLHSLSLIARVLRGSTAQKLLTTEIDSPAKVISVLSEAEQAS